MDIPLGKPVARRAEVVSSGLKWDAPSICNVGSYQERHSMPMSGLHTYRYIHIYIYPWAPSHANMPTHMVIFYTYMHIPGMGPFIFSSFWVRVGSHVGACGRKTSWVWVRFCFGIDFSPASLQISLEGHFAWQEKLTSHWNWWNI